MTHHTQAAPAAGADARHPQGYFLSEDAYQHLLRATATAALMCGYGEYAAISGMAPPLTVQQFGAIGESIEFHLRTTLAACQWGGAALPATQGTAA